MRTRCFLATIAGAVLAISATRADAIIVEEKASAGATTSISRQIATPAARATDPIVVAQANVRRAHPNAPQIFLLKGLADVFSSGMDTLAVKLQRRGISARVASHAAAESLADEAARRYKAGARGPIIIVGHSLGADGAVYMAQRLNESKVPVALIVSLGPVASLKVTPNVARAVNYYQANSSWRGQILRGPGFRGSLANINLDDAPGINHFNIDKNDKLHNEAIAKIMAAIGHARRPAATTQNATSDSVAPRP